MEIIELELKNKGNVVMIIPVTDSAERNAQLQGEDCVKLVWSDVRCANLPALSYIDYGNERFYLQNTYIPTKKGDVYSYNVKFVKIHNLFSDAMFLRNVNVDGVIWQEPQFDINANKKIMTDMVVESINNLPFVKSLGITFKTPYNSILQDDYYQEYVSTKLESFSFDCSKVAEVLNNIADTFETEWWVEDTKDISVKILHIDKCQTKDITLELSDNYIEESDHTYTSMGLTSVEPDNNNNIPERLYVYGSDRNITKKTVQQQVEGGVMNVSYAKRLRLNNEVAPYETKTKSGVAVIVNTNESSISIKNVSNGKMDSYTNEDIYPKMNMVVSEVREERNSEDMPLFYLKSENLTSDFMDSEIAESYPDSLNPSRQGLLIEGTTLMVTFTSGLLNGMEFECAWYQSRAEIGIIPEESDDQQIPYGSIRPKAGDTFVLWNLMMPQSKIREAQAELLADALNYIDENVETITGCKCKSDALYFAEHNLTPSIKLGRRIKIDSEVFANTIFNASSLTSRVKSYSYKLTKPYDVTFNLSEARSEGVLSSFENQITDIKIDAKQNTELARSISRRQWHDIEEMSNMIESIKTQMLVVGKEHDNFAMTSSIVYDNKTKTLSVSLGVLTHASYVKYGQNGAWKVTAFEKKFTDNEANIPYYIYARCSKSNTTATIYTSESEINDDSTYFYFLIGILSSEYENARVFNKTSGLSTITGGTITTEQIQDYNRSLIIDFSSNPPRIIARNGAIIEGAIKFTSFQDNSGRDVLDEISDIAKTAEDVANQTKDNLSNLSIGGENIVLGAYKYPSEDKAFSFTSDEDDDSNPRPALTCNLEKGQVYTFTAYTDGKWRGLEEVTQTTQVDSYLINVNDASYIHMTGADGTAGVVLSKRILDDGRLCSTFKSETTGEFIVRFDIDYSGNTRKFWQVQVEKGSVPSDWKPAETDTVKPLYDALKGSTEVVGGLVNTNVLMVKDNNNAISGGISGVSSDNIAFWSGGTLTDAIGGNCNVIIRKDGTAKIGAFLIEKGVAKIQLENGDFATMSASGIEIQLTNGGKATYGIEGVTIIDNQGEEKIKLVDSNVSIDSFVDNVYQQEAESVDTIRITNIPQSSGAIYSLTSKGEELGWRVNKAKNNRKFSLTINDLTFARTYDDVPSASTPDEYYNVRIVLVDYNDNIIIDYKKIAIKIDFLNSSSATYYVHTGSIVTYDNKNNIPWTNGNTGSYNQSVNLGSFSLDYNGVADVGTWKLKVFVNSLTSTPRSGSISLTNTSASYNVIVENYSPKTLIGINGMFNFQSALKYFCAYLDSEDNYHIEAKGKVNLNGKEY